MQRSWVFFNPQSERAAALKELNDCPASVQEAFRAYMEIWLDRQDLGGRLVPLGDDLWEFKAKGPGVTTYRMVVLIERDEGVVLTVFNKKSKRGISVPPQDRDRYEKRAKQWRARPRTSQP